MRRSSRRGKTEGTLDRVAGRPLEMFSKLTGKRSTQAKGKTARARGRGRTARGATKRRWAR